MGLARSVISHRQVRGTRGTFVAHKSEKRCPAGSTSVNKPRTKRWITNLPNGFRSLFESVGRRFEPDGAHHPFVPVTGLGSAFLSSRTVPEKGPCGTFCATSCGDGQPVHFQFAGRRLGPDGTQGCLCRSGT
jgi:hypothetical protein